jgi:hypothetical protein
MRLTPALLALLGLPLSAATLDDNLSEFKEALAYGKPSLFIRARSEHVSSDAFAKDSQANTLRVALGYETKPYHAFSAGVQFEGVYSLGDERYNSGFNGHPTRPLVADHSQTNELQQAYLKYAPTYVPGLTAVAGRQEINLENQRYIGAVGWRQDWQTFDAYTVGYKPASGALKGAEFSYAYLDDVQRITPDATALGAIALDSHAITVAYTLCPQVRVVGYAFLLDFDTHPNQAAFLTQSTETTGARAAGAWKFSEPWSVIYAAEYAKQQDYGRNPLSIDATYTLLEAGIGYKALSLKFGYELLSGDVSKPGSKFTTPLATLHAFQGWADLFLTTPTAGIVDTYVWLAGPLPFAAVENFRVGAAYHDFAADDNSDHYGTELDLQLEYSVKRFDPKLVLGIKQATYRADDKAGVNFAGTTTRNSDTEKLWIYSQYAF